MTRRYQNLKIDENIYLAKLRLKLNVATGYWLLVSG